MAGERTFVIVGAGQAGAWIARTLRAEGFDGRVVLIGDEPHAPYERPPLSKSILTGDSQLDAATLLSADQAARDGIELWTGQTVVAVDAEARSIRCASGVEQTYDTLFLATGGRARTLAGFEPQGRLHLLRTFNDAMRLKAALTDCRRLIVVGGGWIGLEVAATARNQDVEVVLIEGAPRLCARATPAIVSDFLARLHRAKGVDLRLNAAISHIQTSQTEVRVKIGEAALAADQLLLGIGMTPAVDLAVAAGLRVDNGIVVDASGRTSDPHIFAAGDATLHPSRLAGGAIRLESWANAQNQAIVAAKAALGQDVRYDEPPWAWSDQYGVNLQIIGLPERGVRFVTRGAVDTGPCCWLALDAEGLAVGAVAVDAPRDLRMVRKALGEGRTLDLEGWNDAPCSDLDL